MTTCWYLGLLSAELKKPPAMPDPIGIRIVNRHIAALLDAQWHWRRPTKQWVKRKLEVFEGRQIIALS